MLFLVALIRCGGLKIKNTFALTTSEYGRHFKWIDKSMLIDSMSHATTTTYRPILLVCFMVVTAISCNVHTGIQK